MGSNRADAACRIRRWLGALGDGPRHALSAQPTLPWAALVRRAALVAACLALPPRTGRAQVATAAGSPDGAREAVRITFLDVGQGDAIVIRSPEGRAALVDAGPSSTLRALARLGADEIELLVATHPHADHIGGMVDVLTARPVRFFMDNGKPHTTATYEQLMATVERLGVTYLAAEPRTISLDEVTLQVLPLPPLDVEHNDRSVGLVVRFGRFAALLTGDSERGELSFWVDAGVVPDVVLLKAPHHGAANGFTTDFLEAAHPELVVISVGEGNQYQHPRPEALAAYRSIGARVLRTDQDGNITVLGFADGGYDVVTGPDIDAARNPIPTDEERLDSMLEPSDAPGTTDSLGAPASSTVLVVSVFADAPGDDRENLNGEYATIENRGRVPVAIGRWRLCDLSTRCFRFPDGARIEPGRSVTIYTGYGMTDGASFFMNNDRPVWNNGGDEATLYDERGDEVLRYVYD